MNRARLSTDPLLTTVIGLVLYVAMWLIVLPAVADTSARLAVLTLALFTGLYCYAMAHLRFVMRRCGPPLESWPGSSSLVLCRYCFLGLSDRGMRRLILPNKNIVNSLLQRIVRRLGLDKP